MWPVEKMKVGGYCQTKWNKIKPNTESHFFFMLMQEQNDDSLKVEESALG